MEIFVKNYLSSLKLGKPQSFENMAVFPLLTSLDGGPDYITLKEALNNGVFVITEVSEGGSVPELMVQNKGEVAVLLLDGEELAGAKQNRILNTAILVSPKTSLKVPVSCTEHGRWSYASRQFADAGHIMAMHMRRSNMENVHASLESMRQFRSNQGQVWDEVAQMSAEMSVPSATGAMKDVYEAKNKELADYLKNFRTISGQKGALVFIAGKPAGMDFVSRDQAFEMLFPKLVKSFAMEAMLAAEHEAHEVRKNAKPQDTKPKARKPAPKPGKDQALEFLKRAAQCEEKKYESVGTGWSYRYTAKDVVGSALALDSKVIHMAFFGATEADKSGNMASMSWRRRFRV